MSQPEAMCRWEPSPRASKGADQLRVRKQVKVGLPACRITMKACTVAAQAAESMTENSTSTLGHALKLALSAAGLSGSSTPSYVLARPESQQASALRAGELTLPLLRVLISRRTANRQHVEQVKLATCAQVRSAFSPSPGRQELTTARPS